MATIDMREQTNSLIKEVDGRVDAENRPLLDAVRAAQEGDSEKVRLHLAEFCLLNELARNRDLGEAFRVEVSEVGLHADGRLQGLVDGEVVSLSLVHEED